MIYQKCSSIIKIINRSYLQIIKRFCRLQKGDSSNTDEYNEERYKELFSDTYIRPTGGNNVMAIQPDWKFMSKKFKNTTSDLRLSELVALIESIPNWKVEDKMIFSIKHDNKSQLFGKGQLEEIVGRVKASKGLSAVVVGVDMLNASQLAHLQRLLALPVYDRYTIVIQIFQSRAKTSEARLQVALAEIPYLKSRLHGMHSGELDQQIGSLKYLGGQSDVLIGTRKQLLHKREMKIRSELDKLAALRLLSSGRRKRLELPTIAVVGYTNSGKTSLIKQLSGDDRLKPRNQLFATLDITTHCVALERGGKALMYDTIGFITDMPHSLMESFAATLHDITTCDLLLLMHDASHPDAEVQLRSVHETLHSLTFPNSNLLDKIIIAHNKVDLLPQQQRSELETKLSPQQVMISVKDGFGLEKLVEMLSESIIQSTMRIRKVFRVPSSGPIIQWLYKEATVEQVRCDDNDANKLFIHIIITPASLAKFNSQFRQVKHR